ncbi:hypothetical protein [Rhizorhapis suberifaciens]|uniref:Uncharacterized protein n=1 Tax=Rhizorhapis suberifaciens TaxID=13656 RepID=A0A840HUN4_9SPHN|nr:hypothetical protein [Rhizorhapis suberifaciens]MBB4641299.1 hypothetical protein [Rhizorhapis suberifaciens]
MGREKLPKDKDKGIDRQRREPEPSWGPDEEGELPLEPDHIPNKESGAWVKRRGK